MPGEATGYNNIAEIWDPATGQWRQGAVAQKMRLYHSNALLLPDGSVLVSGGGATSPTLTTDPNKNNLNAEIYYPPYLFTSTSPGTSSRAARPTVANVPTWIDIGKTFALDVADAASVSRVTLVKTGSTTHSFNMDQRFLDLTFNASGSHVAVQAPTHAGDAPPGFYLLFVFNEAGVPSVGKIVRMGIASNPNPAIDPVLTNPGAQASTVGALVDLALSASDPNGDVLSYAATGLPPGLAIDASSGRITGTPTTAGSYSVVVSATDGINTATAAFVWTTQAATPLILEKPAGAGLRRHQRRRELQRQRERRQQSAVQVELRRRHPGHRLVDLAQSATHTYASPGTFVVTVYVKDDSGQERSRSVIQAIYLPATAKPPAASSNLLVENPPGANPRLWVVNQDNDSVSVFDAATLAKLGEVAVGIAPRSIARAPNGMIWVVAKQSGSLSVINPSTRSGHAHDHAGARLAAVRDRDVTGRERRVRHARSGRPDPEVRHDELRADRQRRDRPERPASVDQRRRRAAVRLALRDAAAARRGHRDGHADREHRRRGAAARRDVARPGAHDRAAAQRQGRMARPRAAASRTILAPR